LVATYDDGVVLTSEHDIDEPSPDRAAHRIVGLTVTPQATITEAAESAILDADLIILGPGDLYTSILANCVVEGVADAICHSTACVVYVSNLMTKLGQTSGLGVSEHVAELSSYIGRTPDTVLVNSAPLPSELLARYAADGEFPVALNCESDTYRIIPADLLATEIIQTNSGDVLKRSLIRHDPRKLARQLIDLL